MCCFVRITCLRGHWVWPCSPQTLVSLTVTVLSFRVSFLSPGVSQHDSCSLQEHSHAKISCSALSFPLALCLKEGVSRHVHTLILSFTKLENKFSTWLGRTTLFSYFFKCLRLRPPTHLEKLTERLTDSSAQDWFWGGEKSHFNLQSSSRSGFTKVQQDLSLVSGCLYFWFMMKCHFQKPIIMHHPE